MEEGNTLCSFASCADSAADVEVNQVVGRAPKEGGSDVWPVVNVWGQTAGVAAGKLATLSADFVGVKPDRASLQNRIQT